MEPQSLMERVQGRVTAVGIPMAVSLVRGAVSALDLVIHAEQRMEEVLRKTLSTHPQRRSLSTDGERVGVHARAEDAAEAIAGAHGQAAKHGPAYTPPSSLHAKRGQKRRHSSHR